MVQILKKENSRSPQCRPAIGRTDVEVETPIFGHLMRRADSFEKTLMPGKIEGRRRGRQKARWLDVIPNSVDMSLNKLRGTVKDKEVWRAPVHGIARSWTQLSD